MDDSSCQGQSRWRMSANASLGVHPFCTASSYGISFTAVHAFAPKFGSSSSHACSMISTISSRLIVGIFTRPLCNGSAAAASFACLYFWSRKAVVLDFTLNLNGRLLCVSIIWAFGVSPPGRMMILVLYKRLNSSNTSLVLCDFRSSNSNTDTGWFSPEESTLYFHTVLPQCLKVSASIYALSFTQNWSPLHPFTRSGARDADFLLMISWNLCRMEEFCFLVWKPGLFAKESPRRIGYSGSFAPNVFCTKKAERLSFSWPEVRQGTSFCPTSAYTFAGGSSFGIFVSSPCQQFSGGTPFVSK